MKIETLIKRSVKELSYLEYNINEKKELVNKLIIIATEINKINENINTSVNGHLLSMYEKYEDSIPNIYEDLSFDINHQFLSEKENEIDSEVCSFCNELINTHLNDS